MAQYIIPGVGLVNDASGGTHILIPGSGLYQEDSAAAGTVIPVLTQNMRGGFNYQTGGFING